MKAERNPYKINNREHENISNSTVSLAKVLRQLKTQGTGSKTSSTSTFQSEKLSKLRSLYENLESGRLSSQKFTEKVQEDCGIKPTEQFYKTLENPNRNYTKLLRSLGETPKAKQDDYYSNPKTQRILSSTSLTTLGSQKLEAKHSSEVVPALKVDWDSLTQRIKAYSKGNLSKDGFCEYLTENNIPISSELEKNIREHESCNSVPFQKIGKSIYNSLYESEQTSRLAGSPHKKDPSTFTFLNGQKVQSNPVHKEKMKEELLKKELDQVATGQHLVHRRKAQPSFKDNGEITAWSSQEVNLPKPKKKQDHLKHSNIFSWNSEQLETPNSRKARITQRAALDSGNIINWG